MNETHFTFAGVLALIVLLAVFFRHRFSIWKLLTNPLFYVCATFYSYFGSYRFVDFSLCNNFLLLMSFSVFLLFYYVGKHSPLTILDQALLQFPHRKFVASGYQIVSRKGLLFFILLIVIYCIVDIWLNSMIYGGLERALLRFYSTFIYDTVYVSFRNYLSIYFGVVLVLIFIYRYYLNVHRKDSLLFILGVLLLVLIAIPRGARGAVLAPIVMVFFADIFAKRFCGVSLKKYLHQYVILGIIGLVTFFMLTAIRSMSFESFDDLSNVLESTSISTGAEGYAEREGELMIVDTKLCFDVFGSSVSFLPVYYSASSILLSFVPRFLWEEKPVSFGLILNAIKERDYGLIGDYRKLNYPGAIDWAAGVAGEGWANGGLLGLLFYSFIFGWISGKCSSLYYRFMAHRSNYIAIVLALMLFQMSFCFIRGGLQSTFTPILYAFILILIIFKLKYRK